MVSKRKDNIPPHPESAFEWLLGPKSTFRLQLEIGVSRAGETPLTRLYELLLGQPLDSCCRFELSNTKCDSFLLNTTGL